MTNSCMKCSFEFMDTMEPSPHRPEVCRHCDVITLVEWEELQAKLTAANKRVEEVELLLAQVRDTPDAMLRIMQENGIVIDNRDDPMTKFASTCYSNLVHLGSQAEQILEAADD